jgi:predicted nucleotide-binding protein
MSEAVNPYDCSNPGSLFMGYEKTRQKIVRGIKNGSSYAILGGRRCGKTSLLLQLETDLQQAATGTHRLLPSILDMQAVTPRSTSDFFSSVLEGAMQDLDAPDARPANYQEFLKNLDRAKSRLEQKYGPNWIVVLLIDELETAMRRLPDTECLENLRNLLTISRYKRNFRAIAAGVFSPAEIASKGSPLNNLNLEYLSVLDPEHASRLIAAGFPHGLQPQIETWLLEQTGRRPYLLQGVLGYVWDFGEVTEASIVAAGRRFVRDRDGTFRQWLETFRSEGCRLYQSMLDGSRRDVPNSNALAILSYHGVVDETAPGGPQLGSARFRDWFWANYKLEATAAPGELEPLRAALPVRGKRVFVVHGRNMLVRNALFTFLRSLGLEPLEWTALVEATNNPAPHINEILKAGFKMANAAVVLLTPDEEARVRESFRYEDDPKFEGELSPQPRPNVLFEAGMAMAHFPERTVLVQVGWIRPFSDIAGIHAIKMDNSFERRSDLAQRLRIAGCEIKDLNSSIEWQTVGDFSIRDLSSSAAIAPIT